MLTDRNTVLQVPGIKNKVNRFFLFLQIGKKC